MREEISEPQHWRSRSSTNPNWSTHRQASTMRLPTGPFLPADLVDAAFSDERPLTASRLDAAEIEVAAEVDAKSYPEIIASLSDQLAQLEAQGKQLQKLLAEASEHQS